MEDDLGTLFTSNFFQLPEQQQPPQMPAFSPPTDDAQQAQLAREAAAARQRNAVVPQGGRQEGLATQVLVSAGNDVAKQLSNIATLPQRAGEAAQQYGQTGEYNPAPFVEAAGLGATGGMPMAVKGSAGVFGGRLAQTADHEALARAQGMAGKGTAPEQIWKDTGWFQGADKDWRFEIPDAASRWTDDPALHSSLAGDKPTPINQTFSHPELYEAYPQLRDADLNMMGPGRPTGYKGTYQAGSEGSPPTITLAPGMLPTMRSTALHELQHGVQDIEGFGRGGTPYVLDPQTPAWGLYQERLNAMRTPTSEADLQKLGVLSPEYTYKDYLREHHQSFANDNLGLDRMAQEYAARTYYSRLAGEVEARNVQKRADWSPQELRATSPLQTQEFPNAQQFVRRR